MALCDEEVAKGFPLDLFVWFVGFQGNPLSTVPKMMRGQAIEELKNTPCCRPKEAHLCLLVSCDLDHQLLALLTGMAANATNENIMQTGRSDAKSGRSFPTTSATSCSFQFRHETRKREGACTNSFTQLSSKPSKVTVKLITVTFASRH